MEAGPPRLPMTNLSWSQQSFRTEVNGRFAPQRRAMDLTLAFFGVLLFSPVFAVLAIAVRLSSPGPIIFRQQRVGRMGSCSLFTSSAPWKLSRSRRVFP